MIYMLAIVMMLTTLIATGFALIQESGNRRPRPFDAPARVRPLVRRR